MKTNKTVAISPLSPSAPARSDRWAVSRDGTIERKTGDFDMWSHVRYFADEQSAKNYSAQVLARIAARAVS